MARKTREMVFAQYGIKYDTESGKIFCDPLQAWIPLPLVNGNEKIGRGVWHHSTLAGTGYISADIIAQALQDLDIDADAIEIDADGCKGTCACDCVGCYAKNGCYQYSSTKAALFIRTYLFRVFPDWTENAIRAQIDACNIKMCRIHASGDFFSDAHVRAWIRIIQASPDCIFWTYTKTAWKSLQDLDALQNANIVKSLIDGKLNFGHCGYLMQLYQELKAAGKSVWICKCGLPDLIAKRNGTYIPKKDRTKAQKKAAMAAETHCNKCNHCFTAEYVLFLEHGTSYNAVEDPDFDAFVKLVMSQPDDTKAAA